MGCLKEMSARASFMTLAAGSIRLQWNGALQTIKQPTKKEKENEKKKVDKAAVRKVAEMFRGPLVVRIKRNLVQA